MKMSAAGLALLKSFEGCVLTAYRDPVGVWTIGYGHTSAAGLPVVTPGMKITQTQAAEILIRDLVQYETAVQRGLKRVPSQNQFDAMVSLCYNIGPGGFAKSQVLAKFNAGDFEGAAAAFLNWSRAGNDPHMLLGRRMREAELFRKAGAPVAVTPPPPPPDVEKPPVVPPPPVQRPWWQALLDVLMTAFGRKA